MARQFANTLNKALVSQLTTIFIATTVAAKLLKKLDRVRVAEENGASPIDGTTFLIFGARSAN